MSLSKVTNRAFYCNSGHKNFAPLCFICWNSRRIVYSDDLHWRIVSLIHIYNIKVDFLSNLFGPTCCSIHHWYGNFLKNGSVRKNAHTVRASRWPANVLKNVENYVNAHPTFYIEELQHHLQWTFPDLKNISESNICRALNFDLQLSNKKIYKSHLWSSPRRNKNIFQKIEAYL